MNNMNFVILLLLVAVGTLALQASGWGSLVVETGQSSIMKTHHWFIVGLLLALFAYYAYRKGYLTTRKLNVVSGGMQDSQAA